jgi:protein TonB
VLDAAVQRVGTRRAGRRAVWLAAAAALHLGLAAVLVSASTRTGTDTGVEVKLVAGPPAPPAPAGPALPPPPRRAAPPDRPRRERRPAVPVIQPREMPAAVPAPQPAELPEPAQPVDGESDEGVVGGAPGGVAAGPAAATPFDEGTMTRPVFLSGPSPEYTRRALEREVEGLMAVKCVVTAEGAVRDCRVLQGLPFMDAAVVDALERRRYRPATRNGQPVEVSYLFRLHLKLPR